MSTEKLVAFTSDEAEEDMIVPSGSMAQLEGDSRAKTVKGTSTLSKSVINLFKAITGAGVLSLSSGVASFTDDKMTGTVACISAAFAMGVISTYTFSLIGRLCIRTDTQSYTELFETICGPRVAMVVQGFMMAKVCSSLLLETIVIGNLARDLGELVTDSMKVELPESVNIRTYLLGAFSLVVLIPLGFLKSFAALAPVAAAGALGIAYIAILTGVRLLQQDYAPGGSFFTEESTKPSFDKTGTKWESLPVLIAMFGTAYIAHYNSPKFARQLQNATGPRFTLMSVLAFGLAFVVMSAVMVFGFLTFGGGVKGLILDSYATEDTLAVIGRVAVVISTTAVYPFLLFNVRDMIIRLTVRPRNAPNSWRPPRSTQLIIASCLTATSTIIGMVIHDLGLVVALVGSLLASSVCFTLPALSALAYWGPSVKSGKASLLVKVECAISALVVVFGLSLACFGTYQTLKKKGLL